MKTEHEEQREFVQWFRRTFGDTYRIFAIPNGGARSISVACRLKVEGVSKGVPDLFCPAMGLWIEMKRAKGGVLSKEQKEWMQHLEENDYRVIVAKGCDDAIMQVKLYSDYWRMVCPQNLNESSGT
jgi:hypothetical protein